MPIGSKAASGLYTQWCVYHCQAMFMEVKDPLGLIKLTDDEWGNFKNYMNFLYNKICRWDDDKS